jgi:hypothetical protein
MKYRIVEHHSIAHGKVMFRAESCFDLSLKLNMPIWRTITCIGKHTFNTLEDATARIERNKAMSAERNDPSVSEKIHYM